MSGKFLHGIEIKESEVGLRSIGLIDSSIIGIIGTAPGSSIEKNTPILIKGSKDPIIKTLGSTGTIPTALAGIFDQTEAQVVLIRMEDSGSPVAPATMPLGRIKPKRGEGNDAGSAESSNNGDTNTGNAESSNNGNANIKNAFKEAAEAFLNAESIVHKTPRILIAPDLSSNKAAIESLLSVAERLRGIVIAECPDADKDIEAFTKTLTPSDRLYLIYPSVLVENNAKPVSQLVPRPASAHVAGVIVKSDNERGFWYSPSNRPIMGISGTKSPITFALGDMSAMANELNNNKVATIIHQNGYRLWGNRSFSDKPQWKFLSVRRTADAINDSLLQAHFWAIDRNITKTYVTDVIEGVNIFLRDLKAKGAILGGKCWANPDENTPDKIQLGQIAFNFDFTPPYPAEQITFTSSIVDNYLKELFS